ncbi:MAG: hypothetical protein RIA69_06585 [Cyclobacteriaceae bacterium]
MTLREKKLKVVILILILISLIFLIIAQPVNVKFSQSLIVVSIVFAISIIYEIGLIWLKFNPNESSIIINKSSLNLKYPKPKEDIEIPFTEIRHIQFNRLSDKNAASIITNGTDEKLIKLGIDFESHSVNSMTEEDWKIFSDNNKIELIIGYELDTEISKSIYIIQKDDREESEITDSDFENLISKMPNINYLGIQEIINSSSQSGKEPLKHYSIDTKYGVESFDFVKGKIAATYLKGKTPEELINIEHLMGWTLQKL